jgi:hypothetical protein
MNNETVINAFLQKKKGQTAKRQINGGYYCYEGRTLTSDGETLINYSTIIAKHIGDKLYLNKNKYSRTTSKIQSQLHYIADRMGFTIVECGEITEKEVK